MRQSGAVPCLSPSRSPASFPEPWEWLTGSLSIAGASPEIKWCETKGCSCWPALAQAVALTLGKKAFEDKRSFVHQGQPTSKWKGDSGDLNGCHSGFCKPQPQGGRKVVTVWSVKSACSLILLLVLVATLPRYSAPLFLSLLLILLLPLTENYYILIHDPWGGSRKTCYLQPT